LREPGSLGRERVDILDALVSRLHKDGLVVIDDADARTARVILSYLGNYKAEFDMILRPCINDEASRRSTLSGLYGYKPIPWHTDGAVAFAPAEVYLHAG
jgi:hypothetical protein